MIIINVNKTTIVKPADHDEIKNTPRQPVQLSVLDRIINHPMHNSSVHLYRPNGATNFFDPSVLKEALSKVLVHFYPIAGRYRLDDRGHIEINCNDEGVIFVEAETSSVIDDFGDFGPTPEFFRLVPAIDYSGGLSSYPLMLVQVTYFKCGGVSLGIAMEHHTVDGTSALHLINSWSKIARGLNITILPFLDRTLLGSGNSPQPKFNHIEYEPPSTKKISQSLENGTKIGVFKMTKEQLNIIKTKAKQNSNSTELIINYSTFETLAGHIWKCVCKARTQPDDQETTLYFPVNGRNSRLQPPLPHGFFGNVIFAATSTALAGDIKSKPLGHVVDCIHKTLAKMTSDYLRSAIDYLELQPDLSVIRRGAHTFQCPNLGITSWARLGNHDADFGWGQPFYMGPGRILYEGKSYILPSAIEDGSLSLVIALQPDHMEAFEKLFYEYV